MTATQDNTTKTALVTGASRGLGLALARSLTATGWELLVDGRDPAALHRVVAELGQVTPVVARPGDVADPHHRAALRDAAQEMGGLDAVVHNASTLGDPGAPPPALRPVESYPLDGLRRVLEINTLAPLALTQALLPVLRPGARIVAVTSDAAAEPYPGWAAYGASKAALEQLFAVLAVERPDLQVHRVDPGEMRTRMHQEAAPGEDISDLPSPEASVPGLVRLLEEDVPSGRHVVQASTEEVPT